MLPILKISVEPLAPNVLLTYDRVGGVAGYNDHLAIDEKGNVYRDLRFVGTISASNLQDLVLFLEGNKYSATVESLYDRYKKSQGTTATTDTLHISVVVNSASGSMQIRPDRFINDMLQPFL